MPLTLEEVIEIQKSGVIKDPCCNHNWICTKKGDDENYYLTQQQPCFFYDAVNKTCKIERIKPQACKDYPFLCMLKLKWDIGCSIICPEAGRLLNKMMQEW